MCKYVYLTISIILILSFYSNVYSQMPGQQQQDELKTQGINLFKAEKYVEASKIFRSYLKNRKDDLDGWRYLGNSYHRIKKFKDARKAFETVLKLKPDDVYSLTSVAYYDYSWGDLDQAEKKARLALNVDDKAVDTLFILGAVLLRKGKILEARATTEKLLNIDKEYSQGWLLLNNIWMARYGMQYHSEYASVDKDSKPNDTQIDKKHKETDKEKKYNSEYLVEAVKALQIYLKFPLNESQRIFWSAQLETIRFYAGLADTSNEDNIVYKHSEVNPPRILYKERAMVTDEARQHGVQGTVKIKMVLHKDGTIKHIMVLQGLPYGLNETAIAATRKIKFVPATKDGRAVSVMINVEYSFRLF